MTYKGVLLVTAAFIAGNYIFQFLPVVGKNDLSIAFERSFFQGVLGLYISAKMYFGL